MQLEEGKKNLLPSPAPSWGHLQLLARFNEQGGAPAPCCLPWGGGKIYIFIDKHFISHHR